MDLFKKNLLPSSRMYIIFFSVYKNKNKKSIYYYIMLYRLGLLKGGHLNIAYFFP
jgi:hypothetical protein